MTADVEVHAVGVVERGAPRLAQDPANRVAFEARLKIIEQYLWTEIGAIYPGDDVDIVFVVRAARRRGGIDRH